MVLARFTHDEAINPLKPVDELLTHGFGQVQDEPMEF